MQILKVVPGGNGKKSPKKSYANKYQKHIACIYAISCVDDKFSKPLKTCLACSLQFYNLQLEFTILLIVWSKNIHIVVKWWKTILTKKLWWLKKTIKILTALLSFGFVSMINYIDNDIKVSDHCHITGKYISSAQRDCNINLKLNHKIPVVLK